MKVLGTCNSMDRLSRKESLALVLWLEERLEETCRTANGMKMLLKDLEETQYVIAMTLDGTRTKNRLATPDDDGAAPSVECCHGDCTLRLHTTAPPFLLADTH
jgi:hypothetical protein